MSDLHAACRSGDLSLISSLLSSNPSALDFRDPQLGWTPLYRAVICRQSEAVSLLLSSGADPNGRYALGETALHQAADSGDEGIARELVRAGANVNLQQKGTINSDGDTPLHKAVGRLDIPVVTLLLESAANPNLSNFTVTLTQYGRTPLHYAVESDHPAIVRLLISHGASPFIKDKVRGKPSGEKSR